MMYTSLGGSDWPNWAVAVGIAAAGLSVLVGLFCVLRLALRLKVPRGWAVAAAVLFVVSVGAVGLLLLFTPVLSSADTVR